MGFTLQCIGTIDKKHWLECEKHRNQRQSIGLILKSIGTNENAMVLVTKAKQCNQRKSMGFPMGNIGAHDKPSA